MRSQASLEAMFVIGILLLIFLFAFTFISMKRVDVDAGELYSKVRIICNDVTEITTSVLLEPGMRSSYLVEDNLTLSFKNETLYIENDGFFSCGLPMRVTKNDSTDFSINKGEYVFKNIDGKVVIE